MLQLPQRIRKLQEIVLEVNRTDEFKCDEEEKRWELCVFTIQLTGFTKRTPEEVLPDRRKDKKIEMVRYCCFDWYYKLGVRRTLDPDRTEAVLTDKPTKSVFW